MSATDKPVKPPIPYFVVANDRSTHTLEDAKTANPETEHFPNVNYIFGDDEPIEDAGPAIYVDFDETGTKVTKFHSEIPDWQITDVKVESLGELIGLRNIGDSSDNSASSSCLGNSSRLSIQGIKSKPVYLDVSGDERPTLVDLETTDLRNLREFFTTRNELLQQIISRVPIEEEDFDVTKEEQTN